MDVRSLSLKALIRTLYDGAYSNRLINDICNKEISSPGEKAFFTKLYMGTLENLLLLDSIIKSRINRRLKDVNRTVLCILRLSVYQLIFMEAVTDKAAIGSALKLCEERKQIRAKSFVNGVLGGLSRELESVNSADFIENLLSKSEGSEYLSLKYSVPLWIVEYLMESYPGKEVKCTLNNIAKAEHYLTLRVNTDKISVDELCKKLAKAGMQPSQNGDLPAITLGVSVNPVNIPGFLEGEFYVQDISSIRAISAIGIKPGDKIMDVCAAPGGKGLFAAMLTGTDGTVSMRDVQENKIKIIQSNINAANVKNASVKLWDARKTDPEWLGKADVVICDVPCSGIGTIGNKAEIKYRLKKEDIFGGPDCLSKLQYEILNVSAEYVKPGGRIMYSTCTLGHIENEDNVRKFLEKHGEFSVVEEMTQFPDGLGSDGFYYCVMEKE